MFSMETKPKKPRGPPKLAWDPFDNELWRRLQAGEALPTVQAEAKYLAAWATRQGLARTLDSKAGFAYLGFEIIRERIKKRYNGSAGYKLVRVNVFAEARRAIDDQILPAVLESVLPSEGRQVPKSDECQRDNSPDVSKKATV